MRRVEARRARNAATRMRTCAADIQPFKRGTRLLASRNRAREQELVEREFTVMPVPTLHAEFTLEVDGRQ